MTKLSRLTPWSRTKTSHPADQRVVAAVPVEAVVEPVADDLVVLVVAGPLDGAAEELEPLDAV